MQASCLALGDKAEEGGCTGRPERCGLGCCQDDVALFLSMAIMEADNSSGCRSSTLFAWDSRAGTSERGCSSSSRMPRKR